MKMTRHGRGPRRHKSPPPKRHLHHQPEQQREEKNVQSLRRIATQNAGAGKEGRKKSSDPPKRPPPSLLLTTPHPHPHPYPRPRPYPSHKSPPSHLPAAPDPIQFSARAQARQGTAGPEFRRGSAARGLLGSGGFREPCVGGLWVLGDAVVSCLVVIVWKLGASVWIGSC